jgi:hypothetical protein
LINQLSYLLVTGYQAAKLICEKLLTVPVVNGGSSVNALVDKLKSLENEQSAAN